jgi:periplasmic protein TonB
MELRKMPHLDLGKKKSTFFNIGLALSLALVLTAFEWKSAEMKLLVLPEIENDFTETFEIPPTVILPPPPPIIPTCNKCSSR